jgi:hypothetical protein
MIMSNVLVINLVTLDNDHTIRVAHLISTPYDN